MHPRHAMKSTLERLLSSPPARAVAARKHAGSRLVLCYHNILPTHRATVFGDRSLHLPLASFRQHLDVLLTSGLEVVPLAHGHDERKSDRQVVITFDDACYGAVSAGVRELALRALPATVFVSPGILGCESPWWDLLSDRAEGMVPADRRDVALRTLRGDARAILSEASERGWAVQAPSPDARIATDEEIDEALRSHPGLRLGSHGWSHRNLARLHEHELTVELERSIQWLRERWPGRTDPWIAYPYGLSSTRVGRLTAQTGYAGGCVVTGSWAPPSTDRYRMPRLNITPGLSLDGFRARVLGLWP